MDELKLYGLVEALNDQGESVVMVTVVDKKGEGPMPIGGKMLVKKNGEKEGTVGGGALENEVVRHSVQMLTECVAQHGTSFGHTLINYDLTGRASDEEFAGQYVRVPMVCGGLVTIFYELHRPKPRVWIFGGGNVGSALAGKLKGTCFSIRVCDPAYSGLYDTESNEGVRIVGIEDALDSISSKDMVVIATGSHETDAGILESIIVSCKPFYLGMLASKKKVAEIKSIIEKKGMLNSEALVDLHSPVGLDIGGTTPDEIAISIAAQLMAKHYRKDVIVDLHTSE